MDEEKGVSKESEENAIEEILEKFKFELVYAYMKMVGWTYFNSPNTPTISQLKETAEGLLKDVEKKNGSRLISGGFEAAYNNVEGQPELSLRFVPLETVAYL